MQTYGIEHSVSSWYGALLMGLIACMSVYMIALAFVRWRFFRGIRTDSRKILQDVQQALEKNDPGVLGSFKGHRVSDPPVSIMVAAGLANREQEPADLQESLKLTIVKQKGRLEKGLSAFGTMATIGPFLGLLATVLGIIESFHNLAQSGAAGPNVVASGVAAALWGTAAGLVVAIPSVVFYNIFGAKAKAHVTDMELTARELMLIFRTKRSRSK